MSETLTVPALKLSQNGRTLFLFSLDGKKIHDVADVSHLTRDEEGKVLGYQRPEVAGHIAAIRSYLETDRAMMPNAVILALDKKKVKFEPSKGEDALGHLTLPIPDRGRKAAYIVDGQQRSAAVRDAELTDPFPICCVGFIAANEEEEREQFVLINTTKPLGKSLIYELLPNMAANAALPPAILKRRLAAAITSRLNSDEDSPLLGLVKMPSNKEGVIQDNTVMLTLEASLTDGALVGFKDLENEENFDLDRALSLLKTFWAAVEKVFKDAWALPPKTSRLTHAAGMRSMGLIMDSIFNKHQGKTNKSIFVEELTVLAPHCHFTQGEWTFSSNNKRPWDSIQSTTKDVNLLCQHMLTLYRKLLWKQPAGPTLPEPPKVEKEAS